jgi:serine/threonine-protein kinase
MGHVYRATDTKLKRQIAIKILPPSLAAGHGRLARFQRASPVSAIHEMTSRMPHHLPTR